ncbi:MAG: DOMON domain-containing protein [Anaerolineae bacterium]
MKKQSLHVTVGVLAVLLVMSACGAPSSVAVAPTDVDPAPSSTARAQATETTSPLPTRVAMSALATPPLESPIATPTADTATANWSADGIITDGEYASNADFGDMRIWWRNDEDTLYLGMEGDTSGWVAIGLNPQQGMQGADYLFGYVENGEALLWDAWGTAPRGPNHPPDEDLGGTDDIVDFAGVEEAGVTRFELQIPLDSGDDYDHTLEPGENYPFIVAIGHEDDYDAYHTRYDRGEITIE